MPRRNLYLLFAISLVSIACYIKADAAYRDRYAQMSLTFIEAMKQIDQSYVEPVPDRQLFEGAMHGMVAQLGDPYSAYEPPRQAREFREELDQQFGGIGIECDPNSDPLTITLPMPGTPAQQAGILAGDQISAIDGQPTKGMKFDDCRRLMRGEPGSTVRLTIERPKEPGSRVVEIVRAVIQTPSIVGDRRDAQGRWIYTLESHPNIGYLHIASFGEQTVNELETALASLEAQPVEALVLDLRQNSGGILRSAVGVCDQFVSAGRIVTTRGRDKTRDLQVFDASGNAHCTRWPMAVLVDHLTASAAEIVAACLQDSGRAVVVGERTWGKGTVQNIIPLENGQSALKLTVATYWRRTEKNIHRTRESQESDAWGVTPDAGFEVPLGEDDLRKLHESRQRRERTAVPIDDAAADGAGGEADDRPTLFDPVLDKATEYLRAKMTIAAGAPRAA
jgi:carboxyl-terminal processing protease